MEDFEKKHITKKEVRGLRLGDLVLTDYIDSESEVVRRIDGVMNARAPKGFGSGRGVTMTGGSACKSCGKLAGTPIIPFVDAQWITKVVRRAPKKKRRK